MVKDPNDADEGNSRRGAVIGLVITLAIIVAGYFLVTALQNQGRLEDCLMSGRTNCAPLDIGPAK